MTHLITIRAGVRSLLVATGALTACGDDPLEPPAAGGLAVTVTVAAGLALTQYTVSVNGEAVGAVTAGATVTADELEPGDYSVGITTPAGCVVEGDNPRTVTVAPGDALGVDFSVDCGGSLRVVTTTTGDNPDAAFDLYMGENQPQAIGANATLDLTGLAAGGYQFELGGIEPNCHVSGLNPVGVTVVPGGMQEIQFPVSCATDTGNLVVRVSTIGAEGGDYGLSVDGRPSVPLPPEGVVTIWDLAAGNRTFEFHAGFDCSVGLSGDILHNPGVSPLPFVAIEDRTTSEVTAVVTCP